MYSSLLEYINASDMVRSDHDSYEHDVVLTVRSLTPIMLLLRQRSFVLLL